MLEIVPDAAVAFDEEGRVIAANARAATLFGRAPAVLVGLSAETLLASGEKATRGVFDWMSRRKGPEALRARRPGGVDLPVDVRLTYGQGPEGGFVVVTLQDAKARLAADRLKAAETAVLEMIAQGAPLTDVLQALTRGIEAATDGMMASVLIMHDDGRHLVHCVAPTLPKAFVDAVKVVAVGPRSGSCGTAAFRKKTVVVRDIETDPLWALWRDVALSNGLRACWSSPIVVHDGSVLGTFALYYNEPREPRDEELKLIRSATHLAGIVLVHHRAEKLREVTEGRYRLLSELTSDFAYAFSFGDDGVTKVEWVTDAFSRITGFEAGEWESRGAWRSLVHPDDALAFEQRLPRLMRGEEVSSEVRIVTKSGDVRWLSVFARPTWNEEHDRVTGVVGAARDFTTRKDAEDAKTLFLATASHELKTPLTVIQGFAQMLSRGGLADAGLQREAAETIERRARDLGRILERILLSSRIETGKTQVTMEDVDLGEVLAERVNTLSALLNHQIALHVEELPTARADVDVAATVIDHLLDNAVKYSPDGGPIHVRATFDGTAIWVSVADSGIGMTPENVARCFERFWQAESSDVRRFGGTGIGLYIVRSLVEAMGGDVRVQSVPGTGSEFSFSVRAAKVSDSDSPDSLGPGLGERTLVREGMRQIGVPTRSAS